MSQEQLTALLAQLRDDERLQTALKGAVNLDAAVVIAKEAGFDVSKMDWLNLHAKQTLELSDQELGLVAAGKSGGWFEPKPTAARDTAGYTYGCEGFVGC